MIDPATLSLVGLLTPPVFDFLKKLFIKPSKDTVEATANTLATTKPELVPEYLKAQADYLRAKGQYEARDVNGIPSQWVINLRAGIRPFVIVFGFIIMILSSFVGINIKLDQAFEDVIAYSISSWFGNRLVPDRDNKKS